MEQLKQMQLLAAVMVCAVACGCSSSVQSLNTDFHLAGRVIDDDGRAVEDVNVSIETAGHRRTVREEGENSRFGYDRKVLPDGRFDLSFDDVSRVRLLFYRDDYLEEWAWFRAPRRHGEAVGPG